MQHLQLYDKDRFEDYKAMRPDSAYVKILGPVLEEASKILENFDDIAMIYTHNAKYNLPEKEKKNTNILYIYNWCRPESTTNHADSEKSSYMTIANEAGEELQIRLPSGVSDGHRLRPKTRRPSRGKSKILVPRSLLQHFPDWNEAEETEKETEVIEAELTTITTFSGGKSIAIFEEPNVLYLLFDFTHAVETGSRASGYAKSVADPIIRYIFRKINKRDFKKLPLIKVEYPKVSYTTPVDAKELTGETLYPIVHGKYRDRTAYAKQVILTSKGHIASYRRKIKQQQATIAQETDWLEVTEDMDVNKQVENMVSRIKAMNGIVDACLYRGNLYVLTEPHEIGPFRLTNVLIQMGTVSSGFTMHPIYNGEVIHLPVHPFHGNARGCLGRHAKLYDTYHQRGEYDVLLTVLLTVLRSTNSGGVIAMARSYQKAGIPVEGLKEYDEYIKNADFSVSRGNSYVASSRDMIVKATKDVMAVINGQRVYFTKNTERLKPQMESGSIKIPEMFVNMGKKEDLDASSDASEKMSADTEMI